VPDRHPDHDLLRELEPLAEQLLNRHLSMAKDRLPHEYVPWRLGRDFDVEPWTPDQPRLTGVAQAAFEVNLLTEDNLPSYHHQLLASFGRDGAWNTWSRRGPSPLAGRRAAVSRRDAPAGSGPATPLQAVRPPEQVVGPGTATTRLPLARGWNPWPPPGPARPTSARFGCQVGSGV
jgi:hypothetical protein